MISRPPTSNSTTLGTLMHMDPFTHDAYKEAYIEYEDFKEVFQQLQGQIYIEEGDSKDDHHLLNGFLYNIDKLCVPKDKILQLIREAHTSKFVGIFGVGKTVIKLQRHVY
jgi:hypothetical protein